MEEGGGWGGGGGAMRGIRRRKAGINAVDVNTKM